MTDRDGPQERHVLAVRLGHGANCSSIGSVIDTLFATATVGSAVFAAVLAALDDEAPTVVVPAPSRDPSKEREDRTNDPPPDSPEAA